MPNIVSQIVGPLDAIGGAFVGRVGLYIKASNGHSIALTRAQILAHFASETGTRAVKRAATIAWVKQQIQAALGDDMIDATNITQDFDDTEGTPTDLTITG